MLTVTGGHLDFIGTEGEVGGEEGALGFMVVGEGRRVKEPPAKRSLPPYSGVWAIRSSTHPNAVRQLYTLQFVCPKKRSIYTLQFLERISLPKEIRQEYNRLKIQPNCKKIS